MQQVVEFGRTHAVAIGLALACALGFTSFHLLRAGADQIPVLASSVEGSAGSTPSPASAPASVGPPAPVASAQIQVHVIGEVTLPGVVHLPPGSRVADAISAAGGLTSKAKPGDLNLAAPVSDGSQIVVAGGVWPSSTVRVADAGSGGAGSTDASSGSLVNLNTATAEQLESLPGVGPVTAQRILDWRHSHGRFTAVAELQEISGIGPKLYATLAPLVTV